MHFAPRVTAGRFLFFRAPGAEKQSRRSAKHEAGSRARARARLCVYATEYEEPAFALSVEEFVGATENREPPFALIGPNPP